MHRLVALVLHNVGESQYKVEAKINPAEWTASSALQELAGKEAEKLIAKARKAEPASTALVRVLEAAKAGRTGSKDIRIR